MLHPLDAAWSPLALFFAREYPLLRSLKRPRHLHHSFHMSRWSIYHALMVISRRKLRFASLGEVMPDVEQLLAKHVTVGRWSLGQILHHLVLAIRLPMDGVPVKFSWPVRRLFGPVARTVSFSFGWIPEGVRAPDVYVPPTGLDAIQETQNLRAVVERFAAHTGRLDEHPLMGRLSRAGWERFHCLHCAHHLSFAVPVVGLPQPTAST
jgi:hypothetical protein